MAYINTYLQKIMEAIYGEEVRGSIYNALEAMNTESTTAMNFASRAKDSAQASAVSADLSASKAQNSASKAAISEENAKVSEQSAATSEQNAANSASAAAASEQNAAKSEAVTSKFASEVRQNAEEAAKSAAEAAASALTAKQYSGKPPKPDQMTGTWWIWDATLEKYVDSRIGSEIEGPQGVGIESIKLTSGDHTPGTADIYTVKLSDGSSYNISVWNGQNGEGAGDILGKSFDLVIPAIGWNGGQITIADERLVALSTYKYFIGAVEASREKYLDCQVRPKDITTTGFITFVNETDPEEDLTVSVIRLELSANG